MQCDPYLSAGTLPDGEDPVLLGVDQGQVVWLSPPNYLHKRPDFGNCKHCILVTIDLRVLWTCISGLALSVLQVKFSDVQKESSAPTFGVAACVDNPFELTLGVCERAQLQFQALVKMSALSAERSATHYCIATHTNRTWKTLISIMPV